MNEMKRAAMIDPIATETRPASEVSVGRPVGAVTVTVTVDEGAGQFDGTTVPVGLTIPVPVEATVVACDVVVTAPEVVTAVVEATLVEGATTVLLVVGTTQAMAGIGGLFVVLAAR